MVGPAVTVAKKVAPNLAGKLFQLFKNNQDVLSNVAIGSGLSAGYGLVFGGPKEGIAYGLSDLAVTLPLTLAARGRRIGQAGKLLNKGKGSWYKQKPDILGKATVTKIDPKTGQKIIKDEGIPVGRWEQGANFGGSAISAVVPSALGLVGGVSNLNTSTRQQAPSSEQTVNYLLQSIAERKQRQSTSSSSTAPVSLEDIQSLLTTSVPQTSSTQVDPGLQRSFNAVAQNMIGSIL